jgi:lipoprotein NlpI
LDELWRHESGIMARMPRRLPLPLVLAGLAALAVAIGLAAQDRGRDASRALDRAVADFEAGRIAESARGFDQVVALDPGAEPHLWQRGIAQYYAGQYTACRRQFERHRTVNPDDVENAAWHFLCVARADSPAAARAALLPVGPDRRVPMSEIYQMFRGTSTPDKVLAAADAGDAAEFYGHLYVALYYEAIGDAARSQQHMRAAADQRFARAGGYMHMVARVHSKLRP